MQSKNAGYKNEKPLCVNLSSHSDLMSLDGYISIWNIEIPTYAILEKKKKVNHV